MSSRSTEHAENTPNDLAGEVALLGDFLAHDFLEAIGSRGAAAHEEVAVLFRVLHLGEG